jgi:hypothetical protein
VRPESRSEPVTIRSGPANVWFLGIRARARHVLVGDWLLVSRPDPVSTARSMAAITETLPPRSLNMYRVAVRARPARRARISLPQLATWVATTVPARPAQA